MTFCGADYFVSTTETDLINELKTLVPLIEDQTINSYKKECLTTLT